MNVNNTFLTLLLTSILFTGCKDTASEKKVETATPKKEIAALIKPETTTFTITGMTCAIGCAKTIEKELAGMEGVVKATVDFDKKEAIIEFDAAKQTPEKLVKTVEATADGKTYTVSNVKSTGNQATLLSQDQEKAKTSETTKTASAKSGAKSGCCAAKKICSKDEKKTNSI